MHREFKLNKKEDTIMQKKYISPEIQVTHMELGSMMQDVSGYDSNLKDTSTDTMW